MLSPSHTPQPSSQRPSLPQVTVTTVFDNGRVTLLECQIPEIGYHRWDLAEKCFGSPVPAWAPEDGKRLGERFHSPEQPTSTIDDALRQYIGTVRYEARLIKVKQPNSVYTLFENDQPLYTATASFTAYDPNQSLQNVGRHIVWELADGRHPTILVDGLKMRVPVADLKPATEPPPKAKAPKATSRVEADRSRARVSIKLLGMYADEAIEAVDRFLSDALINGLDEVEIIHGTGTGVLVKLVTDYLKAHPKIQHFYRLPGNLGATIVEL